jgi:hypothetical protein
MMVLRARRGATGSKYVTVRGGLRRAIPFLLVRSGCGAQGCPILCEQNGKTILIADLCPAKEETAVTSRSAFGSLLAGILRLISV